jgi:hypothetical protein
VSPSAVVRFFWSVRVSSAGGLDPSPRGSSVSPSSRGSVDVDCPTAAALVITDGLCEVEVKNLATPEAIERASL